MIKMGSQMLYAMSIKKRWYKYVLEECKRKYHLTKFDEYDDGKAMEVYFKLVWRGYAEADEIYPKLKPYIYDMWELIIGDDILKIGKDCKPYHGWDSIKKRWLKDQNDKRKKN